MRRQQRDTRVAKAARRNRKRAGVIDQVQERERTVRSGTLEHHSAYVEADDSAASVHDVCALAKRAGCLECNACILGHKAEIVIVDVVAAAAD